MRQGTYHNAYVLGSVKKYYDKNNIITKAIMYRHNNRDQKPIRAIHNINIKLKASQIDYQQDSEEEE